MADLSNCVVLVTGATAGMGEAIARRFVKEGARVVLTGRREDRLRALAEELGERTLAVPLDVRDRAAVNAAIAGLPADFAEVDILVNNAGLALGLDGAAESEMDDWEVMVDTNVKGVLYCSRALLPGMVARNRGHVINIGSVASDTPYPGGNVYGASKAFVRQFSLNLKADLLGTDVRVSCVEPAMTKTEFAEVRFKGDTERAEAGYQGVDYMTADDIADVVFYIAALPTRVNVNLIQLMPPQQAFAGYAFDRR